MRASKDLVPALILLAILILVNLFLNPARFSPANLGATLGLAAPLLIGAAAAMPAILGGRGGIDVSVGPTIGFVNAFIVVLLIEQWGVTSPFVIIPAVLLLGLAIGMANGFLATALRIQPIVATLGSYLVLVGLTLHIAPSPIGSVPEWMKMLAGSLSLLPISLVIVIWLVIQRFPCLGLLLATGSDDRAAYTSGVPVATVRFISYALGGLLAAIAGLALTALIGSADPSIGPKYTLTTISAVTLGGVSLAGGRGGLLAALVGAACIFLLQTALTYFNVSTFVLQIVYGAILVLSVSLNAIVVTAASRRKG